MLTLQILNSDAQLNNFQDIGSFKFTSGEDITVVVRLIDASKNLRYIPASGATFSIDLLKSDGTTYTKTPTYSFDPDDRSILTFDVTAVESNEIISQDLKLFITEGSTTKIATLQAGLSKSTSGSC